MTNQSTDPFTYEVLRHRLEAIAREGAIALQRVSGSPLATEAFDLNTSIMSAAGEVVFVGPFLLTGPMGQGMIVRAILRDYPANPGIEPGDMFLCNDPYVGAAHQNCVTLVAPIHDGEALVAWTGATLHVVDVGGPTAGQVGLGARSIFEEAPPIPPLRIVAGGRLLRDVEAEYLRRSRTPELNALDLRAKVAALSTIRDRVLDLVRTHGTDVLAGIFKETIDRSARHLARRIAALPGDAVSTSAFVDHPDEDRLLEVRLRLSAKARRLRFDFTGSSEQAGAIVNCTRSGLASGVLVAVLTSLMWDMPWCPAAIERSIDIVAEPGSVVDARWPAGCSMATMGAGFAATTASALAIARLLATEPSLRHHAMAAWAGAVGSVDVFGTDVLGRPFGTVLLDSMASGTGAREWADGIDSGGFLRSISCVVSNVEEYEARFPLLYLWRRHEPDTGGPGRRRGGVGVGFAVIPHGVDRLPAVIPHFGGTMEPESGGLRGGYPGATNGVHVVRAAGAVAAMRAGRLPVEPGMLAGSPIPVPAVARLALEADDALVVVTTGGGGWGDPLDRDPAAVAADVRARLVGGAWAVQLYGVVVGADGSVDVEATDARRAWIRRERAVAAGLGDRPTAREAEGSLASPCPSCGGAAGSDGTVRRDAPLAMARRPLTAAGPHVAPDRAAAGFQLVERACPTCLRLVDVERAEATATEV